MRATRLGRADGFLFVQKMLETIRNIFRKGYERSTVFVEFHYRGGRPRISEDCRFEYGDLVVFGLERGRHLRKETIDLCD